MDLYVQTQEKIWRIMAKKLIEKEIATSLSKLKQSTKFADIPEGSKMFIATPKL